MTFKKQYSIELYYNTMAEIGACTPKELAKATKSGIASTHRYLKQLRQQGLVGIWLSQTDGRTIIYYLKR